MKKHTPISRRTFVKTGLLTGSTLALTRATFPMTPEQSVRQPEAGFKISCAAYSYRQYLTKGQMNLDDFIDRCATMVLDAVELTSYYFPETFTQEYLNHLKHKTFLNGLDISGTAIRNNFCLPPGAERDQELAHVKKWIDYAAGFGAPVIRIFAGNPAPEVSEAQAIQWVAECNKISLDYAAQKGVFLAMENHGGITARAATMKKICDQTGAHPWFGVNLDTGNFKTEPYEEMAVMAPLTINVQVKDYVYAPDGQTKTEPDLKKILTILRQANYRGYLVLEYEGQPDPLTAVPEWIKHLRQAVSGAN